MMARQIQEMLYPSTSKAQNGTVQKLLQRIVDKGYVRQDPVMRWAQRNLRATEEICCDELLIGYLNPKPYLCELSSIICGVPCLPGPPSTGDGK